MTQFCRYDLRTSDADAARSFYRTVLGHEQAAIWPLHEEAVARGARPHWLGQLGVEDVDRMTAAFVERGAVQLGPTRPTPDGARVSVLRDPGGAIVALRTLRPGGAQSYAGVAWHALNTNDVTRAKANYQELFGWEISGSFDLGAHGIFQPFAWQAGGEKVGVFGDVAGRAGVHPHWLFCFEVDALDLAIAATRAAGGLALDSFVGPGGERLCVCDDPQGAAFGLRERRRAPSSA